MIRPQGIDGFVNTGQFAGLVSAIRSHIDTTKPFKMVEIGVWSGFTSAVILEEFPNVTYFGIDPYVPYPWAEGERGAALLKEARALATERYKNWPNAQLIISPSQEVVATFGDNTIDCAFIDGDHDNALRDFKQWWPKVNTLFAGHDYLHVCEIKRIVDGWQLNEGRNTSLGFGEGDLWYFVKQRIFTQIL